LGDCRKRCPLVFVDIKLPVKFNFSYAKYGNI
jgi:hypothetical protein